MNEIAAIGALGEAGATAQPAATNQIQSLTESIPNALSTVPQKTEAEFSSMIADSLAKMDSKVAHADKMVTQFAVDGSTPIHQVTIALEEARLSVELAMQVRQRFVEGYRQLMNMQL
ncbi:flagellar hook-basal body complex protein FliE [Erythrobacter sp. W53]|uniref:flagellar hook-basal body complex protein FliE n=1 Tax=Erythrobacteraceae TaxID=335929 RepID=UPI0036D2610A